MLDICKNCLRPVFSLVILRPENANMIFNTINIIFEIYFNIWKI